MQDNTLPTLGLKKNFTVIRFPQNGQGPTFTPRTDSFRLANGAFVIGVSGCLNISVNFVRYEVKANTLLTIVPHHIVQAHEASEDFEGYILLFTPGFVEDINLLRSNMSFLSRMHYNPILHLQEAEQFIVMDYCSFLLKIETNPLTNSAPEIHKGILTSMFHAVGALYRRRMTETVVVEKLSRSHVIFKHFLGLLAEHYAKERSVSFYADKLCITPKYLGSICREISSCLATDIIANAVILDAKSKLHDGRMTVQEVSNSLNFPNASFFGRYFKRHTGYSPMQYRGTL